MLTLFKILGVLLFAKKLPDILKKMFNIDVKGDFQLNPFKKIQDNALGGKKIMGLGTGIAGAALGAGAAAITSKQNRGKNIAQAALKGFSTGTKNPSSIKGLGGGFSYMKEQNKGYKEAQKKLQESNHLSNMGKNLYEDLVRKSNGKTKTELSYDPITGAQIETVKRDIDPSQMFQNEEYRNSYQNVKAAKKAEKKAEAGVLASSNRLAALNAISTANMTDAERQQHMARIAQEQSILSSAKRELEDRKKATKSASEAHELIKQQGRYQADAEREKALETYMSRTPGVDVVSSRKIPSQNTNSFGGGGEHGLGNQGMPGNNSNSSVQNPTPSSTTVNNQNVNGNVVNNGFVNVTRPEPKNQHHPEFRSYEEIIKDKKKKRDQAHEELEKLSGVMGDTKEKQELREEIQKLEAEITADEEQYDDLCEQYPEEAAEELEYQMGDLDLAVEVATREAQEAQKALDEYPKKEFENWTNSLNYQRIKRRAEEAEEKRKDAESVRDMTKDKIEEFRSRIQRQELEDSRKQNGEEQQNRIAELMQEADELNAELRRMEERMGPTSANTSPRGRKLRDRLEEITYEIEHLK